MASTSDFEFEGHRLVYDEYGAGERVVLLLHGLLFARTMHAPLAEALDRPREPWSCLDLLGYGNSDRPAEMGSNVLHDVLRPPGARAARPRGGERAVVGARRWARTPRSRRPLRLPTACRGS